jgi:hypothetical protein
VESSVRSDGVQGLVAVAGRVKVGIVGARHGDSDGEVWKKNFDREEIARTLIDRMIKRNGGHDALLDLTSLAADSPRRRD